MARRGFRNSYRLTVRCAAKVPSVAKFRVATIRSEPAVIGGLGVCLANHDARAALTL
jgi:hypothetical protein